MYYYVMEINSCESRLRDKIDIIKRYGFDVSEYEKYLNNIINNLSISTKDLSSNEDYAVCALKKDALYTGTLKKLKELEISLDDKQAYLKVFFRNNSLYKEVNNYNELNDKKVDLFVSAALSLLNDTFRLKSENVDEMKKIIKDVYTTVYSVIKLEMVTFGKSRLLNSITEDKKGIEFINDLVRVDLELLKEEDKYDENIDSIVDRISAEGINYNYADQDLILLIVLKTDKRVFNRLNQSNEYFTKNSDDYQKLYIDSYSKMEEHDEKADTYKRKERNSRIKAIISAALMSLSIVGYKALPSIARKENTDILYTTTREVYDTISDDVRREEALVPKKEREYVVLKQYGEVNNKGERKVITYNLSNVYYDDIEDYLDYNDKNIYSHSTIGYRMNEQISREAYTVIERMYYGDSKEEFDEEAFKEDLKKALYVIYAFGGAFSVSMLVYLMACFRNKRRSKKEINKSTDYERKSTIYNDKIKKYENLKQELKKYKDEIGEEIDIDTYKKFVYKK